MKVSIAGVVFDKFTEFEMALTYDAIASIFSVSIFFDVTNADHVRVLRPGTNPVVKVEHQGELLLTGYVMNARFVSNSDSNLVSISGYSKTGVLEDSNIPTSIYPLQSNGLSVQSLIEKLITPFGVELMVDPVVSSKASAKIVKVTAQDGQTIKDYLSEVVGQRGLVLTHTPEGKLYLTEAKSKGIPVIDFEAGKDMRGIDFTLDFNGQQMHQHITTARQASKKDKNVVGQSSVVNPYCNVFKAKVERQTVGDSMTGPTLSARSLLGSELKYIALAIVVRDWSLENQAIKPNSLVTVKNPELFLFNKTKFFIETVVYKGNSEMMNVDLSCYLPEVYNTDAPQNIFI